MNLMYILERLLSIFRHVLYVNTDIRKKVTVGKHVKLYPKYNLFDTNIGDFTYISYNSNIKHTNIGKFCSIGQNCIIGPGLHPTNYVTTSPTMYSTKKQCGYAFSNENKFKEYGVVNIGNDVFIGANVIIMPGVNVSNGAIIAAGAVVTKDVPPYAIVGGVPAKVIKYRFNQAIIDKLLRSNWWDWDSSELSRIPRCVDDIDEFISVFDL